MSDDSLPTTALPADSPEALALAQRTLDEFLGKMQVRATVTAAWGALDPEDNSRPLILDVRGDDLDPLIGRQGETLNAIQHLLRLMLSKQLHPDISLIVDVQGHKQRREEQVRRLAHRMAEQAIQRKRTMSLEPMPAHERRLIHIELRDHPHVRTESTGEGSKRKVTIVPK
jgi:spoIIIJ-associated protein